MGLDGVASGGLVSVDRCDRIVAARTVVALVLVHASIPVVVTRRLDSGTTSIDRATLNAISLCFIEFVYIVTLGRLAGAFAVVALSEAGAARGRRTRRTSWCDSQFSPNLLRA